MSGYQPARRGPNVSQYIAGLNAIPPPASGDEVASLDNEDYNFDDDLALFTNTVFDEKDFVDFNVDFGANLTQSPLGFGPNTVVHNPRSDNPPPPPLNGDIDTMNFDTDFQFPDLPYVTQGNGQLPSVSAANYDASPTGFDFNIPPDSPYINSGLKTPVTTPPNGLEGRPIVSDVAASLEASSRVAAEEDKRRRNTAASARFRIKKKQREQALEKTAKDMSDKVDKLEEKVCQLEKENQWLREIVVEKTAKTSDEVADLYRTFKDDERSTDTVKKGVGTRKLET